MDFQLIVILLVPLILFVKRKSRWIGLISLCFLVRGITYFVCLEDTCLQGISYSSQQGLLWIAFRIEIEMVDGIPFLDGSSLKEFRDSSGFDKLVN